MKKTKRWKLEDCYYGGGTKFDRNFVNNYEGSRLQMHRVRDRRNRRSSHAWIRTKYTEGLLKKYINQPIENLEKAFNARVKNIKNPCSFKSAYSTLIYDYHSRWYRRVSSFEYRIIDGILKINPEYKRYKSPYAIFKPYQLEYNKKHIINPGEVRCAPLDRYSNPNSGLKDLKPIYLGKLYVLVENEIHFVDVYHYYKHFYDYQLRDPRIASKKAYYEHEWIQVKTGIHSLDYYKEERNPRYEQLIRYLNNPNITDEECTRIHRELKWTRQIITNNYGLGPLLCTVCKRSDLEKIKQPQ